MVSNACSQMRFKLFRMSLPQIPVALGPTCILRAARVGRPHLHPPVNTKTWQLTYFLLPLLIKGDASKSDSEVDFYARSLEDVSGDKKDLTACSGETSRALYAYSHEST